MSFLRKLNQFLEEAKNDNVIDAQVQLKLNYFAKERSNKSATSNFSLIFGGIGSLAIFLGVILVISYNWHNIDNLTKISGFLILLAAAHILAIYVKGDFPKTANILHFLGAGLVIAGIGLIAQIYHLSSDDGRAFLLWFILILPLAIILKNKLIGVLSVFAFYSWVFTYLGSEDVFFGGDNLFLTTLTIISVSLILIPLFFKISGQCFGFVKGFGGFVLMTILAIAGFALSFMNKEVGNLHPLLLAILIFNIVVLTVIFLKKYQEKDRVKIQIQIQGMGLLALTLILMVFLPFMKLSADFIAVVSWVLWFSIGFWSIFYGSEMEDRKYISLGVWTLALGIILRFFDIFGGMLKNGGAFIFCGIILIAIGFITEKYRQNIIKKLNEDEK